MKDSNANKFTQPNPMQLILVLSHASGVTPPIYCIFISHWIAMTFCTDIHGSQTMHPNDFTFPTVTFVVLSEMS